MIVGCRRPACLKGSSIHRRCLGAATANDRTRRLRPADGALHQAALDPFKHFAMRAVVSAMNPPGDTVSKRTLAAV